MSAADAPKAWDLRCYVREKLIEFLQERYPESLPKIRAEVHSFPLGVSHLRLPWSGARLAGS